MKRSSGSKREGHHEPLVALSFCVHLGEGGGRLGHAYISELRSHKPVSSKTSAVAEVFYLFTLEITKAKLPRRCPFLQDHVLHPCKWAGSEGWGLTVHHLSVTGPPRQLSFTFRVAQTVGVNAAEASDTVKFPRFTFGCVPRRQEERKEGAIEDKREGWSAGWRRHLDRAEKKTEKGQKRETGVKITAVFRAAP